MPVFLFSTAGTYKPKNIGSSQFLLHQTLTFIIKLPQLCYLRFKHQQEQL